MNTFLAVFGMPLFMFISGYFSHKMEASRFRSMLLGLIETFLIFQFLHILIEIFGMGHPFSLEMLIVPRWTLWYLLCMVFWRTAIQLLAGKVSPSALFWGSIVIGCFCGFVPLSTEFSFQRTFTMAPYFMLGYLVRCSEYDLNLIRRIPIVIAVLVVAVVPFLFHLSDFPFLEFMWGHKPYSVFSDYSPALLVGLRAVSYVFRIIVSVCVFRLIPYGESWLSEQGKDTLFYYLYHPFIIYVLYFVDGKVGIPTTLLPVILYAGFAVLVIWAAIKVPFFRSIPRLVSNTYASITSRGVKTA